MSFPFSRMNDRHFAPDWSGEVFTCDIDRTYLATRFSSLKGLARIPVEFAIDKRDIEGMVALLKETRRGPGRQSRSTPLYFISASPSQLRGVIQRKMLLDGLEYDGTTFKDWGKVIRSLRLRRLKEQVGYKLSALLAGRADLPVGAKEVLIGDDLESDALTFSLYADLLARRIPDSESWRLLVRHGVAPDDATEIRASLASIPPVDAVRRILIRLEKSLEAEAMLEFAPHLAACWGAFQMAACLWDQGSIALEGVRRVAQDMVERGTAPHELGHRLQDCARRGLISSGHAVELRDSLAEAGLVLIDLALPEMDPRWSSSSRATWTPVRWTS